MNDELQMERNRQQWIAEHQAKKSKPKTIGFPVGSTVASGVLLLFCVLIWSVVSKMNNSIPPLDKPAVSTNAKSVHDGPSISEHDEAQEHAKSFILKTLKAPDSAKFPPYSEIRAVKVAGLWEVSTYVDAQNSFGAMIRTPYHLKMENQGALWRLAYIGQEREQTSAFDAPLPAEKPAPENKIHRSVDKDGTMVFSDNPR